ncbi:MAG: acyloxyacyl hydrolase [Acidobacteriota bacterium]
MSVQQESGRRARLRRIPVPTNPSPASFRSALFGLAVLSVLLLGQAAPAAADERWAFALGAFDVGTGQAHFEGGIERRFAPFALWQVELTPMIGLSASEDGNYWGYVGARYDFDLGERWRLSPSFAVTAYEDGSGKRLGGVLEFRSGIELSVDTDAGRFGLLLYHLSNAGIYDFNPGSESLVVTWSPRR